MEEKTLIGIVLGSDSDLAVMSKTAEMLDKLGLAYEINIISAHRTPEDALEYSRNAASRGLKVIIAGAGKAAHLPGVLASMTPLPVIGVPLKTPDLGGEDSLLSMVQMPPGVPVATMAIDGAQNAAIFAAQILGAEDEKIRRRVAEYKAQMAQTVREKNKLLAQKGLEGYDK